MIGLDGATFEVLDPLIDAGLLPNLRALRDRGVHGRLETVFPVISPPAWTSATTGVNPGKHNVFDFFHSSKTSDRPLLTSSLDRRARPVWQVLNDAGFRTGIMNVPMTFPPDRVDGFFISGFPYGSAKSGFTYPAELEAELGRYPLNPFGESIQPGREGQLLAYLRHTFEVHSAKALELMRTKEWDLFWVVFTGTDKVQHFYWKFADPAHPEYDAELAARYGSAIREFFIRADEAVGRLVAEAGPEANVMVVSDHGFGPIYRELRLVNWLREEGFVLPPARSGDRPYVEALAPGPFGGLLRVNEAGRDHEGAIPRAEAAEVRERLAARLEALRDPETGEPFVEKVYRREEVFSGPYLENAPDVLFLERRGRFVGRRPPAGPGADSVFGLPSYTFSGFHRPDGVLLAAGPDFAVSPAREEFSILDIAPTIYWLFDLDLPQDLDGEVRPSLVGTEALTDRPVRWGGAEVVLPPGDAGADLERTRESLEALPYVQ